MSYRFCFGASGSGKSHELHKEVIRRAMEASDHFNYMVIVPEQYTMQTQKELVMEHPRHGIMNIDVLSFGRLAHRILEETGADVPVLLDDTGKNLIIRKIAAANRGKLKMLASQMGRPGMVSEVKSVLSEFMQYGIGREELQTMMRFAEENGQQALKARLEDLAFLYDAFREYEKDRFITKEENLELLEEAIPSSVLLSRSVLVFDGFTGFTPAQYKVLAQLLRKCPEITISLQFSERGRGKDTGIPDTEQFLQEMQDENSLFYLTGKTVRNVEKTASELGIRREKDLWILPEVLPRFQNNPMLAHLEKNLFRYPMENFCRETEHPSLELREISSPEEEVRQLFIRIRKLVAEKGYCYRDMAVATGDLQEYGELIRAQAQRYEVPVYVDQIREVTHNLLMETIRSVWKIRTENFAYEDVFHYLRSGMTSLSMEETDILENYCLEHGIRGRKKWNLAFEEKVEEARKKFLAELEPLEAIRSTAAEKTEALYEFFVQNRIEERCMELADRFEEEGDSVRSMEYRQIYGRVIELLDQIHRLLGEEKISSGDYMDMLEAGFQEIRLGTLPQRVDRVLVGDMERTRFTQVKALFFVGANDGIVPRAASQGGLISDFEREFLKKTGTELKPSPREQMAQQKLYLYMNLTKPSDHLILSYARVSSDGKSLRPSYLVMLLHRMYPGVRIETPEEDPLQEQLVGIRDTRIFLARMLRSYADGLYEEEEDRKREIRTILGVCSEDVPVGTAAAGELLRTAFCRYRPERISENSSRLLYGETIRGSVSRFELMAQCALRQFLQYGLRLQERKEYGLESSDTGTLLHESLDIFSRKLKERGLTWLNFSREQGRELIRLSLEEAAGSYHDLILYASARNTYFMHRMERILLRTVDTLQYQLSKGDFLPAGIEEDFGSDGTDEKWRIKLPSGKMLVLRGRIDRYDLYEDDRQVYVKLLDYKSGKKDLDPVRIARGLQLQLPVYMDVLLERIGKERPGKKVLPAALLYYHFDDPLLRNTGGEEEIRKSLRPRGMINASGEILERLDHDFESDSDVIPAARKKDGTLKSGVHSFTEESFQELALQVRNMITEMAEAIAEGENTANPRILDGGRTACTYCPFKSVCGFDLKLSGYQYRTD